MNTESMSRCGEGFLPLWLMRRKEKRQKQSIPVSHHLECGRFFIQSVSLSARVPKCLCNLQLAVLLADRECAEMFGQLAACSFDCGQGVCQDVCATCSLQFRLRVFADSDGADMFVQLAACSFDCGSLRTMKVPPVLDTTVVGGRRLQQSRCRTNE